MLATYLQSFNHRVLERHAEIMIKCVCACCATAACVSPAAHSPQGRLRCVTVGALHRFQRLPVQRHRHPLVR